MTKVYGASDDLIEIEGDVRGEVGHMSERAVRMTMSDGTELLIKYGKPDHGGVWWIRLKKAGPLFDWIDECFDDEAKRYSDVAHFRDGLVGARCKGRPVD